MKMGNIPSPWLHEAGTGAALQSPQMRRTAFFHDASTPIRDVGDDQAEITLGYRFSPRRADLRYRFR
jgi:hypothetical protein